MRQLYRLVRFNRLIAALTHLVNPQRARNVEGPGGSWKKGRILSRRRDVHVTETVGHWEVVACPSTRNAIIGSILTLDPGSLEVGNVPERPAS